MKNDFKESQEKISAVAYEIADLLQNKHLTLYEIDLIKESLDRILKHRIHT